MDRVSFTSLLKNILFVSFVYQRDVFFFRIYYLLQSLFCSECNSFALYVFNVANVSKSIYKKRDIVNVNDIIGVCVYRIVEKNKKQKSK